MDPMTRWEAAALRRAGNRPKPGTGAPAVDLRSSGPMMSAATPASWGRTDPEPEPEPDTLLVPLDAWNRMLSQLGNLHEAGRDLADARERAARAETEAEFLRERVHDLRDRLQAAETVADNNRPVADPSESPRRGIVGRSRTVVGAAQSTWRARRMPRW